MCVLTHSPKISDLTKGEVSQFNVSQRDGKQKDETAAVLVSAVFGKSSYVDCRGVPWKNFF